MSLNEELGDEEGVARTLSNLGAILQAQGELAHAAETLDECIRRCESLGVPRLLALAEKTEGTSHSVRATFAARPFTSSGASP